MVANKLLTCMEIQPQAPAVGSVMGGLARGGGEGLLWLSAGLPNGGAHVCILRPSGGSTLTADHLLEL
jgi:hypothetical protein